MNLSGKRTCHRRHQGIGAAIAIDLARQGSI